MSKELKIGRLLASALVLGIMSSVGLCARMLPDTGQKDFFNNHGKIEAPASGQPFFGQDAAYYGHFPEYKDNGNGTITDKVTGLMWSKAVSPVKLSPAEAEAAASALKLAGFNDWRVPNIKELYSLIDFRGYTGMAAANYSQVPDNAIPFINTDYFDFSYGNPGNGERYIDAQWLSSNKYVSTTMNGARTVFGVNFADGRIKGYPYESHRGPAKKFFVRYVRGGAYGENQFVDNGDQTITDQATGLMWMKADSGRAMPWQEALEYAEKLEFAGYGDWRLPDAKELQFIVDYQRSPDTTDSAAINEVFNITGIVNEAGKKDFPYFWTSTTHLDGPDPGRAAAYVAFGRAIGKMNGRIMDVHGAGSQRSDPKTGKACFRGPQGDAVRCMNFVRCVRGGKKLNATPEAAGALKKAYPEKIRVVGAEGKSEEKGSQGNSGLRSRSQPKETGSRRGHSGRFIGRLDKDGDGKVSRSEFDGPPNRFNHHDLNRDGYITAEEAPKAPPPRSH